MTEYQPRFNTLGGQLRLRDLLPSEASNRGAALSQVVVVEATGTGNTPGAALLSRFIAANREPLSTLLHDRGNVLFRGFSLTAEASEALIAQYFDVHRYLWMLPIPPRVGSWLLSLPLIGRLLGWMLGRIEASATGRSMRAEAMSTLAIDDTIQFPHHEYGIFFNIPLYLAFFCEQEAGDEGETLICDAEAAYQALPPVVRHQFERAQHIRYRDQNQRYLPPIIAPAILRHPHTQSPSINLTAYHHDAMADIARAYFPTHRIFADALDETFQFEPSFIDQEGQGYALAEDEVSAVIKAHLDHSVLLKWHRGDLLLMDNFKVMHGRLNAGTPRKTLHVMLCNYVRGQGGWAL